VKISAVLLVGGDSRRFGRDKALFPWNGTPLWKHQLSTLRGAEPEEIIISARTEPPWRPPDTRFVADGQPPCGPMGGLSSTLVAMRGSHLLALAIDMPFMSPDYLQFLMARATAGCGIVPVLNGKPEPLAAIYPRESAVIVAGIIAQQSDLALHSLTSNLLHTGMMMSLVVSPNEISLFHNINEPDDVTDRAQIS
jgi:molybdopterin-guanine dinucleotide biosynthesis protein A